MPEPINNGGDNTPETQPDVFGEGATPEMKPAGGEGGGEEGKDKKKFDAIPDDHPTIVALNKQIEDIKKEYGGNLSGQRTVIDKLEREIETLKKGGEKKPDYSEEVPWKNIKWSKDLTKEQRDDMTDTEIAQMDEIAEMKQKQNEDFIKQKEKEVAEAGKQEDAGKEKKEVDDLNSLVQATAKELSKGEDGKENTSIANQIIESVKQFNLKGLTEEQIKERVVNAAKLVPDYKPPKEQPNKRGNAKDGAGGGDDVWGVDQIVEDVSKGNNGAYNL